MRCSNWGLHVQESQWRPLGRGLLAGKKFGKYLIRHSREIRQSSVTFDHSPCPLILSCRKRIFFLHFSVYHELAKFGGRSLSGGQGDNIGKWTVRTRFGETRAHRCLELPKNASLATRRLQRRDFSVSADTLADWASQWSIVRISRPNSEPAACTPRGNW